MEDLVEISVAISREDGGVSVMSIIEQAPLRAFDAMSAAAAGYSNVDGLWKREVTDAVITAEIARTILPSPAVGWSRVTAQDIPPDRTFRNAWAGDGKGIGVDMEKSREIAHMKRRELRVDEFAPLDKQIVVDIVDPAKVAATEVKRQKVRDKYAAMQTEIDAAVTPDDLMAVLNG